MKIYERIKENYMRKYFEGLKFGLLLQFAVGLMCLMVFNTAQNMGFLSSDVISIGDSFS